MLNPNLKDYKKTSNPPKWTDPKPDVYNDCDLIKSPFEKYKERPNTQGELKK